MPLYLIVECSKCKLRTMGPAISPGNIEHVSALIIGSVILGSDTDKLCPDCNPKMNAKDGIEAARDRAHLRRKDVMLTARELRALRFCLTLGVILGLLGCGAPIPTQDSTADKPMCQAASVNGWSAMSFTDCGQAPYTGQRCVTDCQSAPFDGGPSQPVPADCWFGAPGYGPAFCHASCADCP